MNEADGGLVPGERAPVLCGERGRVWGQNPPPCYYFHPSPASHPLPCPASTSQTTALWALKWAESSASWNSEAKSLKVQELENREMSWLVGSSSSNFSFSNFFAHIISSGTPDPYLTSFFSQIANSALISSSTVSGPACLIHQQFCHLGAA